MPQGLPGCTPGLIPNLALTRGACRHQPRTGLFPPDCCGVAGCGERGEGNPGTAHDRRQRVPNRGGEAHFTEAEDDAETYRRERGKGAGAADRVRPICRPQYRSEPGLPGTGPRLNRFGMKTESPPPKVRRCSPFAEKRWIRFWPYPSETKMSPLGASTA